MSKVVKIPINVNNNLTPKQHMEAADDFMASAEERENDAQWALVEVELAKAHMLAATIKTAFDMLNNKSNLPLGSVAPAILSFVGKITH